MYLKNFQYLKNKETVRKIEEYYVKDFELYEGVDA